jgi:hypothetical protein
MCSLDPLAFYTEKISPYLLPNAKKKKTIEAGIQFCQFLCAMPKLHCFDAECTIQIHRKNCGQINAVTIRSNDKLLYQILNAIYEYIKFLKASHKMLVKLTPGVNVCVFECECICTFFIH